MGDGGGIVGQALRMVGGAHSVHQGTGQAGEWRDGVGRSPDYILEVAGNHFRTSRNSVQFGKLGSGLFPGLLFRLNMIININISSWIRPGME